MRRLYILAAAFVVLSGSAWAETIRGSWTGSSEDGVKIHVNLTRERHHSGQTMQVSDFSGLTAAQIRSAEVAPVRFALNREAGSISFEGTFRQGYGGGQFYFTPERKYLDAIRSMGVEMGDLTDEPVDEALLHLAQQDVSTSYIRGMQAEGYRLTLETYLAMRIHRVTPDLVRELRSLGFERISADDLLGAQIHRVTPAYIREMRTAGYRDLTLEELQSTRIHRVTPEFIAEMKTLGYTLDLDEATSFRIHRVTPEFIRELRSLGYDKISADQLVAMRIHRVTPEFIRSLKDAGYENVPVQKLIDMRIHRIDAEFMKKMSKVQKN
jgi:hypothetical protein